MNIYTCIANIIHAQVIAMIVAPPIIALLVPHHGTGYLEQYLMRKKYAKQLEGDDIMRNPASSY